MLLATEPPLTSIAWPICAYNARARGASISAIVPLVKPCADTNASSACASTSTMALPMPVTSNPSMPDAPLLVPVGDHAVAQIVGRQRDGHAIAQDHADAVLAHAAAQLRAHDRASV